MANEDFGNPAVRIVVIGVGGAGGNAVNRMMDENMSIEFFVMNTDRQSLNASRVPESNRMLIGEDITGGLGSGGDPEVGRKAAEESAEAIRNIVRGAHMVFLAAGMGGGTGTGAAPVIARICKEEKALTLAVVTRPFTIEGKDRIATSVAGLGELQKNIDSIIIVSNDKLLMIDGNKALDEAFEESDKVLSQSVKTIADLIIMPGLFNLDFADVRKTLENSGYALIGYGVGSGTNKCSDAANIAISSPLLEMPINGARRMLCAVTVGKGVSLYEAHECVQHIIDEAGEGVNLKLGISTNPQLSEEIIVSVIASDFANSIDLTSNNDTLDSILPESTLKQNPEKEKAEEPVNKEMNKEPDQEDILPEFLKGKINE